MRQLRDKLANFFLQLLDLLIDAAYLLTWATLNWLVLRALNSFHPGNIIMLLLWSAQGAFAGFALAIILLHLSHDLIAKGEHSDLSGAWKKLKDVSNHLFDLIMLFVTLVAWTVFSSAVHLGLERVRSQASLVVDVSAWILEAAVAVKILWLACKQNFTELKGIRARLFPKQVKQPTG